MWVAKNSYTGKVYSPKFNSIYDCQMYIYQNLQELEWEYRKIILLEKYAENEKETFNKSFIEKLAYPIKKFIKECTDEFHHAQLNLKEVEKNSKKMQEKSKMIYTSNNIIRCYEINQQRFANGFDF